MAPQPDDDMVPPVLASLLKYGVPAAIAVYLVYFLTAVVAGQMRTQTELLQAHVATTIAIQKNIEQDERWHATMVDVMRQVCINGAKSYVERTACFAAGAR